MKKGLTKEEHKELGMKLRKLQGEFSSITKLFTEAYGKNALQRKRAENITTAILTLRMTMDGVCSGDLRSMPNDEWISNHFYLGGGYKDEDLLEGGGHEM